jgi:hypothetical protein
MLFSGFHIWKYGSRATSLSCFPNFGMPETIIRQSYLVADKERNPIVRAILNLFYLHRVERTRFKLVSFLPNEHKS